MKFDSGKLKPWLPQKESQLPGLKSLLTESNADILIIGAAVFELYELLGWLPPLKRKTGDIDLSVGLVEDDKDYQAAKKILIDQKYQADEQLPYRYHAPKKIPGGYTYIDLLAHPNDKKISNEVAASTMGAGPGFSFNGFQFAQLESHSLVGQAVFPNPFGLMALKRESYLNEPTKRIRDFADILELINGLVEKGIHFEMDKLWAKLAGHKEAQEIKKMISCICNQENPRGWDIDDARKELMSRNFDENYIDNTLIQRAKDFLEILE